MLLINSCAFAKRIEFFRWRVTVRVRVELLNQSFYDFLSISLLSGLLSVVYLEIPGILESNFLC